MKHAPTMTGALALTALGLTACGNDEQTDPEPQEAEQTAAEDTTENDDDATITVDTEGQGPYGLYTAESPAGDAEEVTGELIIGPGSCMSLVDDAQPQLLVFGEDAEFVLREGQPGVTTDEQGRVDVGEQIELSAVDASQDSVEGIPNQCAQGAAETVLFVN